MAQANSDGSVQVSHEGLEQMRRAHEHHDQEFSVAVFEAEQMVQAVQAANPFGNGVDGEAAHQATAAFTTSLHAAAQHERDNLEKLWSNFRTWGELVSNADFGAARAISNTAGLEGR